MRYSFLLLVILFTMSFVLQAEAADKAVKIGSGQNTMALSPAELMTPEVKKTIRRGLDWLKTQQNENGSIGQGSVGITAMAGLAFLSNGSVPGRGAYGTQVKGCLNFILKGSQPSGLLSSPSYTSNKPMYGHAFATLFLAEAYGMTGNSKLKPVLKKALKLIELSQKADGGWRYQPHRNSMSDNSVTICQIMALRAAKEAGFYIRSDMIKKANKALKKSFVSGGGFGYIVRSGSSRTTYALAGAGAATLQYSGDYNSKEVTDTIEWIYKNMTKIQRGAYGIYYVTQAMFQAGLKKPKYWTAYYKFIQKYILARQTTDGNIPLGSSGKVYNTGVALLVLQIPNRYMPIFER